MKSPAFSSLPAPMPTGLVPASRGVRGEDDAAKSPFSTLLRAHEDIAAGPETPSNGLAATMPGIAPDAVLLPSVADTGKMLPPPGKHAADDRAISISELVFPLAPLMPAPELAVAKSGALGEIAPVAVPDIVIGEGPRSAALMHVAPLASTISVPAQSDGVVPQATGAVPPLGSPTEKAGPLPSVTPTFTPSSHAIVLPMPSAEGTDAPAKSGAGPIAVAISAASHCDPGAAANVVSSRHAVEGSAVIAIAAGGAGAAEALVKPSGGMANAITAIAMQPSPRLDPTGAARGETSQGRGEGSGEHPAAHAAGAAQVTAVVSDDTALPHAAIPVSPSERVSAAAITSVAPTVPTAPLDHAEAVSRVIDRLAMAREAGMGAMASVAIAHREFGDITVRFAANNDMLEASLAAEDQDKQRALSAALHTAERTAVREPASSASPSSHHAAGSPYQDRGNEGQLPRDSGNRQARGEAPADPRREGAPVDATLAESSASDSHGIYV